MTLAAIEHPTDYLRALPGDDVRQILWRFADRYDLQMLVQSVRAVARGPVARLVAAGARNTHEWTAGQTGAAPGLRRIRHHRRVHGPVAGRLHRRSQEPGAGPGGLRTGLGGCRRRHRQPGRLPGALPHPRARHPRAARPLHGASAPRPSPAKTASPGAAPSASPSRSPTWASKPACSAARSASPSGRKAQEPMLHVEKRGRFITNMGFANFVTAAVESDDPRIKGTCMVILEETDPGIFDRGTPTRKLVHQLSSTRDPIFTLNVPASRIIGGYTVKDGVIVPRTATARSSRPSSAAPASRSAIMTSAKLLSAVEPVIRYHRNRFRGGSIATPGSPRYELGLQLKQDVVHRLVDVWATGEASAALGFEAARVFDQLDPLEKQKAEIMAARGLTGGTSLMKAMRQVQKDAIEFLHGKRPELTDDPLVQYALLDSVANVLCPACKLWNTGHGAQHDARSRQPDGRLRHHRGLPRLPRPQVDGFAARSHLRRPRGRAAPPAQRHHDRRAVPDPVPRVDPRDAPDRQRPSRDRRLRPGHRHADVAVEPQPPAEGHRRRWRQALPELAPGRHLPAGRRALLAAGLALPDSRPAGAGKEGPRGSHRGRRSARPDRLPHRPLPRAVRARRRRSGPRLRRTGLRLQPPSLLGYRRLRHLLPGRRPGVHGSADPRHRQPGARLYRRHRAAPAPTPARPAPACASTAWSSSPACACAWMAASPARSWPRIAPPTPSPRS